MTKAQEALAEYIPTFGAWKQTHVLTNADAGRFTLAGDAERKRVLEEVLGIQGIDNARGSAKTDWQTARNDETVAEAHIAGLMQGKRQAEAALAAMDTPETVTKAAYEAATEAQTASATEIETLSEDARQFEAALRLIMTGIGRKKALIGELSTRSARLDHDECPTCEQKIDADHKTHYQGLIHQTQTGLQNDLSDSLGEKAHTEAVLDELVTEKSELSRAHAAHVRTIDTYRREQKVRRDSDAKRDHLEEVLDDNASLLADHQAARDEALKRQKVLKTVVDLFGAKGFRGHLLSSSIAGLQTLANQWLDILAPQLLVELSITTQGAVDLKLEGAAGGQGYMGASSGERRRVDVALTLALAQLASAASRTADGTLWLDEVFDSLDDEGVSGVSRAVSTLCATRGIVLITHSTSVAALPQATRIEVTRALDEQEEDGGSHVGQVPEERGEPT